MKAFGCSSFMQIQNKHFNSFDTEMAKVTAQSFERENTVGKNVFVLYFNKVWTHNITFPDHRLKIARQVSQFY